MTTVTPPLLWRFDQNYIDYKVALRAMTSYARCLSAHKAFNLVWGLEHEPVYTIGIRGKKEDFLKPPNCPIYMINRGGQITHHGPGQLILYVMLRLRDYGIYPGDFIQYLQDWCWRVLKSLGLHPILIKGQVGVFVNTITNFPDHVDTINNNNKTTDLKPHKLVSFGIHISRGITTHGLSINLSNNLRAFHLIATCGVRNAPICSLKTLGIDIISQDLFQLFRYHWHLESLTYK